MGREPSPFIPPLWVSCGMGLERDWQTPKPLDCLFPTPGVFVQDGLMAAFSVEPCKTLAGGPEEAAPGFPLGALPKSPPLALPPSGLRFGCAFRGKGTDNKRLLGRGVEGQSPT